MVLDELVKYSCKSPARRDLSRKLNVPARPGPFEGVADVEEVTVG
jgi:hypothetical protein